MYQLIALDADGTLLTSDGRILPSTVQAIAWARSRGVRVILATGRSAPEAAYLGGLAGCDDVSICLSGGVIARGVEPWKQFPLPAAAVEQAVAVIARYPFLCLDVFAGPYNLITPQTQAVFRSLQPQDCMFRFARVAPDPADWLRHHPMPVCKVFAATTGPDLTQAVRELEEIPGIQVVNCDGANLEVLAAGVSKGAALKLLAEAWGIPLERVIAVGDSGNDLSMFAAAGMPVAMGNGSPAARAAARRVTGSNDRDGVAQAIRALLEQR